MTNVVRFWILFSTTLVGGGWLLSALHQLNRIGYLAILTPLAAGMFIWWRQTGRLSPGNFQHLKVKFKKRFRRRAPQIFLVIATLSLIGGSLYPPVNFDANAYRLPRIMHWLGEGQWHWIHVYDARMNIAACGMEWMSAPLILFSHTDRLLFLVNWVSYLMLPGLLFSVFTRLQVRPRTAWWWTWWLSSGLCFALQAGSIANDSFATIYILAAVDLALRARETKSAADLWLSLLAAALVTGVKQTDLPLVALWCIAAWPARALFWQNPVRTVAVAMAGLLVSIVPVSVINYLHYGTWMPLEATSIARIGQFKLNFFWGIIGNAFCIPVQNLVPPFYGLIPPCHSDWLMLWNEWMRFFLKTPFGSHFTSFESFGFLSGAFYHGLSEANVGLGLGICIMIFVSVLDLRRLRKSGAIADASKTGPVLVLKLLRLAPWGLLLVFMARIGTFENARQVSPYYVFLFPIWLARPGQSQVTRRPAWQTLGLQLMVLTALMVVFSTERPVFPAQTIFQQVDGRFLSSDFLQDECSHYLYSDKIALDRRNFLKAALPPGEKVIGYYDTMLSVDEPGVWLPYGRWKVECWMPDDPPERLRNLCIHYVVLNGPSVKLAYGSVDRWATNFDAAVLCEYAHTNFQTKKLDPPDFYIARLK